MLDPGFEPGLPRPQRGVLTTRLIELICMEIPGFDPGASRLQSARSSNWAIPPWKLIVSCDTCCRELYVTANKKIIFIGGAKWESNPRPLAPKARIMPLDHWPADVGYVHSCSGDKRYKFLIRAPRIELGTYCVLGNRHNQLDQARVTVTLQTDTWSHHRIISAAVIRHSNHRNKRDNALIQLRQTISRSVNLIMYHENQRVSANELETLRCIKNFAAVIHIRNTQINGIMPVVQFEKISRSVNRITPLHKKIIMPQWS